MENLNSDFEEKDNIDKFVKYLNRIANIYKPSVVKKVKIKIFDTYEDTIFISIIYIVPEVAVISPDSRIVVFNELLERWTREIKKSMKGYTNKNIQVANVDIVNEDI